MSAPAVPLIAVVGMVREAQIIAGAGVTVVIGGGQSAALEQRLEAALAGAVGEVRLLSFGVCGALSAELRPGDLVIGETVVSGGDRWSADPAWTKALRQALPHAHMAKIAAGDAMIGSVAAKSELRGRTGAAAVDMESHVVARLAQRRGLGFAVVRAVSDAADHALPSAALAGLGPDGQPDIGAVLRSLARRPWQLPALLRTASGAEAGFRALKAAAAAISPP